MQTEDDIGRFLQIANQRWLTAREILNLMQLVSPFIKTNKLERKIPLRPALGSLLIINLDKKKSRWKEDGYQYEKRPNGAGFKEYSEKIGDDKSITCYYSAIDQEDLVYQSLTESSTKEAEVKIQRRIYRTSVENDYQDLAVVHYFLSKRFKRSEEKFSEISTAPFISGHHSGSSGHINSKEQRNLNPFSFSEEQGQENSIASSEKISDLEAQIIKLQKQLAVEKTRMSSSNQSSDQMILERPSSIKITDFTPEWDYLEGGSKVILCFDCSQHLPENCKFEVTFGESTVLATQIQSNVVKCLGRVEFTFSPQRFVCREGQSFSKSREPGECREKLFWVLGRDLSASRV